MKQLTFLLFFSLFINTIFCQIPNPSFEEWEEINGYDKPIGWTTNQDEFTNRIIQDSIFKIDGEYSMHFISQPPVSDFACKNVLSTTLDIEGGIQENQSLYFYLKLLSINIDNSVYFQVSISGYQNGFSLGIINWTSFTEEVEDFEQFEIPIEAVGADKLVINFLGGSENAWGTGGFNTPCLKRSVSWLDGLELKPSSTTTIDSHDSSELRIYPNPSFGKIEIQGAWENYHSFKIYDVLGRELEKGILDSPQIEINSEGILILCLESKSGKQTISKIINK